MTIQAWAPEGEDRTRRVDRMQWHAGNDEEREWLARFVAALERKESYEDAIAIANEMFFERRR